MCQCQGRWLHCPPQTLACEVGLQPIPPAIFFQFSDLKTAYVENGRKYLKILGCGQRQLDHVLRNGNSACSLLR